MTWLPSVRDAVENAAMPLALSATLLASVVEPSLKVTVLVVTLLESLCLMTCALRVTELPVREGLVEEVTDVVVGAADAGVMLRVQPPAKLPVPPLRSSTA